MTNKTKPGADPQSAPGELQPVSPGASLLTEDDVYLFKEGNHFRLYDKMGAHPLTAGGQTGTLFSVWAPNALRVAVVGGFNRWDASRHPLAARWDGSGIWA